MHFNDLSDDLLARILEFLDTKTLLLAAPLVSRRWKTVLRNFACVHLDFSFALREETVSRVGQDGSSRQVPTGLVYVPLSNDTLLGLLSSRFRAVRGINLGGCIDITAIGFADPSPTIRQIDLEYSDLEGSELRELLRRLPNLRYFNAAHCFITDDTLSGLCDSCRGLRGLHLEECSDNWNEESLCLVIERCTSLRSLSLIGAGHVSSESLLHIVDQATNLRFLRLTWRSDFGPMRDFAEALCEERPRLYVSFVTASYEETLDCVGGEPLPHNAEPQASARDAKDNNSFVTTKSWNCL